METKKELTPEELEAITGGVRNQDVLLTKINEINKVLELMESKADSIVYICSSVI